MYAYISLSPIGLFAHDANGKQLASIIFKLDDAKDRFINASSSNLTDDDKELIKKLDKKDNKVIFEIQKDGYTSEFPNISGDTIRNNLSKLAISTGFVKDAGEYYTFINELNSEITKTSIKASSTEDRLLVHAVSTIDELESTANTLSIRLKEWYGLYYPELLETVRSNEKLVFILANNPKREDLSGNSGLSMGGDYSVADIIQFQNYAILIDSIYNQMKALETYVETKATQIMPNATRIISPTLASRLLADAGSLEKLAKMPSSTIQVMGAEKALFRHIMGQGPSPKHGLIFQAPVINQSKKNERGKRSRMLASTLSIAFRMDYFNKKLSGGDLLKEKFDKKIENLKG
ncbi:MAG: hypothetical protein K0B07_05205 [DPANN group archaeon]|nr:hypothetical protein [DPANN group archaeon]